MHEGGFMEKWNGMAFHMQTIQNKDKFLEPTAEKNQIVLNSKNYGGLCYFV